MKSRIYFPIILTTLIFLVAAIACQDQSGINDPFQSSDRTVSALKKITDSSPSVNSFTPNYNEGGAMQYSGMLGKDIYPVRVGQKVKLVSKDLSIVKDSVSATGTLVQHFEGDLEIAGSFQAPTVGMNQRVDTVIHKPFTSTITRYLKYKKMSNTGNDTLDWKITSVSLPFGGTETTNIIISKLIITPAQGTSVITINNPAEYFFTVGKDKDKVDDNDEEDNEKMELEHMLQISGDFKLSTWFKKDEDLKLRVEVLSQSADPDVLTITYGAMMNGEHRTKYKFDLVSSAQEGIFYRRVYERSWKMQPYGGRMHAVINALTRSSVYDTNAGVEEKTWGIPYKVN